MCLHRSPHIPCLISVMQSEKLCALLVDVSIVASRHLTLHGNCTLLVNVLVMSNAVSPHVSLIFQHSATLVSQVPPILSLHSLSPVMLLCLPVFLKVTLIVMIPMMIIVVVINIFSFQCFVLFQATDVKLLSYGPSHLSHTYGCFNFPCLHISGTP